jgi:hypothetical protein
LTKQKTIVKSLHPLLLLIRATLLLAILVAVGLGFPTASRAGDTNPGVSIEPDAEPWITPTVNIRARYEYGDTGGRNTSHAATLRSRLGILTRAINGFQAFAEYEGTLAADRNSYQAASVHGLGKNKTIIADPESHELNQLWVSYGGFENLAIKAGRQEIDLDNQRYIGSIAWRQNEQTFDAATFRYTPNEDLTFFYGYVSQVNRIFGADRVQLATQDDFDGNTHLVNIAYTGNPIGKMTLYGYFFDLGNDAGDTNSNQSIGATLSGALPIDPLSYFLEYGYQTDAFDNPLDYDTHYVHAKLSSPVCDGVTVDIGYEYLGSDNSVGYNFPVGTNHAFNGFGDLFLATPANGLQDIYAAATMPLPWDIKGKIFYHKFYNDDGNTDYGNEADLVLSRDLGSGYSVLGKYAYYWAEDPPFTDTNRFSIELNYKF